ncbi:hypothetical protein QBC33DRAFT_377180 [Phialemonium atrogriseum]|uniref:Uncharacterized protein n=1 Tax=Phialemonium atrogriseum TaxID=1093897 RepID=A0AAJ0FHC2_9PEZI|nr:uncharacterized protein QBC33DRAFT_377180 [Phialemonium atrogriseum]KAK1768431.1 hypothetical protein QBC33DRAFT_377180 [Phialemonium atrogriseum]
MELYNLVLPVLSFSTYASFFRLSFLSSLSWAGYLWKGFFLLSNEQGVTRRLFHYGLGDDVLTCDTGVPGRRLKKNGIRFEEMAWDLRYVVLPGNQDVLSVYDNAEG